MNPRPQSAKKKVASEKLHREADGAMLVGTNNEEAG